MEEKTEGWETCKSGRGEWKSDEMKDDEGHERVLDGDAERGQAAITRSCSFVCAVSVMRKTTYRIVNSA